MSIEIKQENCSGCGRCAEVCPGGLIYQDSQGAAFIRYPADCWGCAACLKACACGAISYYLGAEIGGKGTVMSTRQRGDLLEWLFVRADGTATTITTNSKEANKY